VRRGRQNEGVRCAAPGDVQAGVDDQPVQPGRERGIAAEPSDAGHQLEKDLLGDVAGDGVIAVEEIQGD
jgi:hypothetical protein